MLTVADQRSNNVQTGWRRYRWYLALPLLWMVVALARLAGGGWSIAAYFLLVPGVVLVLTRAARGAADVVTIRRADGTVSSRPVISDLSPDEIGGTLEVRVPSWQWVGVRSTDEGTPGWARATAGALALLMIGQLGATAVGARRRFRRLVP